VFWVPAPQWLVPMSSGVRSQQHATPQPEPHPPLPVLLCTVRSVPCCAMPCCAELSVLCSALAAPCHAERAVQCLSSAMPC
jgi:hypothetical protein